MYMIHRVLNVDVVDLFEIGKREKKKRDSKMLLLFLRDSFQILPAKQ